MAKNRTKILVAYVHNGLRQSMVGRLRKLLPKAEIITVSKWNEVVEWLGRDMGDRSFDLLVMDPFFENDMTNSLESLVGVGTKGKRHLKVLLTPVSGMENLKIADYDRVTDAWGSALFDLQDLEQALQQMGFKVTKTPPTPA